MEWSINVRCEPKTAARSTARSAPPTRTCGSAASTASSPAAPRRLREPGYVMRFRKERSFVYSLIADGEEQASSPLEQIARTQIAVGAPSLVRFQLTPTPSSFEERARRLYRRHEDKHVRQERWALPEGGLSSTFNRAEMRAAERTQNRSMFWLETVVAADSREACNRSPPPGPAAARTTCTAGTWSSASGLYRRRFPRASRRSPVVALAGVGRRARAPARAALRADEGRAGQAADDPADARTTRGRPRQPPTRPARPRRAAARCRPAREAVAAERREVRDRARPNADRTRSPEDLIRCCGRTTPRC